LVDVPLVLPLVFHVDDDALGLVVVELVPLLRCKYSFRKKTLTLPRNPTHLPNTKILYQSASMTWFDTKIDVPTGLGTSESPVRHILVLGSSKPTAST
jgi:hypothetical protein